MVKIETVDKTNGLRQFAKSFGQAFSKACAVEAAEASSPPVGGEISFTAFSFDNFSFAPTVSKEKWLRILCNLTNCIPLVYNLKFHRLPIF